MIKNNFRILKKQYAYLQTILKTPVKFQKDWPKTVGGVADTRMVVGADGRTDGQTDRRTDGRTDIQNFGGYNIISRHFLVAGHKNCIFLVFSENVEEKIGFSRKSRLSRVTLNKLFILGLTCFMQGWKTLT